MKRLHVLLALALSAGLVTTGALYLSPAASAQGSAVVNPSLYSGMRWRSVGPARGGRSLTVGGSDARPMEYWFGATGGGAWKTTDGGSNWTPMTDGKINTSSVGSLAVCEANPDVVYIGGGETQFRGNIIQGDGVYKTTDGGVKWDHLADLRDSQAIARLRVHPTNCDVVYAAVLGQVYNDHPQRGIFKSADGGQTWRRTLFRDEKTGGVDLSIDPKNPNVIFASLWEANRSPWGMSSGGPGSGLFKSTDGGDSWSEITRNPGLPGGLWGKGFLQGTQGHLTGVACESFGLRGYEPQVWELGVKEVWKVAKPLKNIVHTMGWPLRTGAKYREFGGSFIYPLGKIPPDRPIFENRNSRMSLVYGASIYHANHKVHIRDTQEANVKEFGAESTQWAGSRARMDLYTSEEQ